MINFIKHFFLYARNGVILNLFGYIIYILMTSLGCDPFLTITITYPIGIMLSFYFHNRYTFNSIKKNKRLTSIFKYLFVYLLGYLINILILFVFHKKLLFPHEAVQVFSIIVISLVLFSLNRKYVFK